jgi:hypothetical protein
LPEQAQQTLATSAELRKAVKIGVPVAAARVLAALDTFVTPYNISVSVPSRLIPGPYRPRR